MTKEFVDYIEDIIKAMNDVLSFVKDMDYVVFIEDNRTTYAVIRALEIIGEATKKVPPSIKDEYSQIPWKKMAGMRDKLIHEYFGVDLKRVWNTVNNDFPAIKPLFEKILEENREK
jgi:uncharacterized protein with HEPN domain